MASKNAKAFANAMVNSLQARRPGGGISAAMAADSAETIVLTVKHIAADPMTRADAAAQIERKMAEIGFAVTSKRTGKRAKGVE